MQNANYLMDIRFGFEESREQDVRDLEDEENDNMLLNDLTDYKKEGNNYANMGPKMAKKKKSNKFSLR